VLVVAAGVGPRHTVLAIMATAPAELAPRDASP